MQIRRRLMAEGTKKAASSDDDDKNEDKRKIFCGNLSEKVTRAVLRELFLQAGPVESVEMPKSKDGRVRNYAFITYVHISSVPYALRLFADVKLYNRKLVLRNRTLTRGETKLRTDVVNDFNEKDETKLRTDEVKDFNEKDETKLRTDGVSDFNVKHTSCARSECQTLKWTRSSLRRNRPAQCNTEDQFVQKLDDLKNRLPRMPLRASNECRIPKKASTNLNGVVCQEYLSSTCVTEPGGAAGSQPTENSVNLPPTLKLTSEFLNNYIYLMQKVIPQWPRLPWP